MQANVERAQVLERRGSWVRVWLPATAQTRWLDLARSAWSTLPPQPRPPGPPQPPELHGPRAAPTRAAGTG